MPALQPVGEAHQPGGNTWLGWYDLSKLTSVVEPARFDIVLPFGFHNSDSYWFDWARRA